MLGRILQRSDIAATGWRNHRSPGAGSVLQFQGLSRTALCMVSRGLIGSGEKSTPAFDRPVGRQPQYAATQKTKNLSSAVMHHRVFARAKSAAVMIRVSGSHCLGIQEFAITEPLVPENCVFSYSGYCPVVDWAPQQKTESQRQEGNCLKSLSPGPFSFVVLFRFLEKHLSNPWLNRVSYRAVIPDFAALKQ